MAKSLDLQVILAARDKVTGPLKKISTTSTATAKALKASQKEVRELQASQRDISSFKKVNTALKANSQELADAQYRARQLGEELKNTSRPTEKMRREYNKARDEVEKFTKKGEQQRWELIRVRKRLKEAGVDTRNLGDAQKKLERQMETANASIKRQQKYLQQLGNADVSGKFSNMTSEVGRFGRRALFATGGAAAGIFGIANSTASLGDEVAKTGDKIGIGLAPFQELRYAAERSGVSTQKLDSSLERFVKRMGEATQGTGAAKKAYEELGLSADQLSQMTPEDSLGVVADRLSAVENQSQRVALAAQLFGREGVAMVNMLKDGSEGLQQLRSDARRTGYVLSEQAARDAETFKDALLDAQLGMAGMKNMIGSELMPVVTELMGDLSFWMRENRDQVKAFAAEFGTGLKNSLPVIRDIAIGAASAARTLGSITNALATVVGGFDNLGMILAFLFALKPALAIIAFAKALFTAGSAVIGLAGGLPAVAAGIKAIGLALAANPIGLIIAAIAGVAYLIYKNWEPIKGFMSSLWSGVVDALSWAWNGIKTLFSWSPLGLIIKNWGAITEWFSGLGDGIVSGLGKALSWITDKFLAPIRAIKDTLGDAWNALFGDDSQASEKIKEAGRTIRNTTAAAAMGGTAAVAPVAAGGVQFDSRPPIGSQTPAAAAQSGGDQYTFNVYAAPGQSAEEIAAQVQRVLEERDRRKAMRAGSALYDRE